MKRDNINISIIKRRKKKHLSKYNERKCRFW